MAGYSAVSGIFVLVSLAAVPLAGAEHESGTHWKMLRDAQVELEEQAAVERHLYEGELAAGVEKGFWSQEENELVRQALEKAPDNYFIQQRNELLRGDFLRPRRPDPFAVLQAWATRDTRRSPALRRLDQQFQDRFAALSTLRTDLRRALRTAALAFGEDVWLAARKPQDLEPAVAMLAAMRALEKEVWRTITSRPHNRFFPRGSGLTDVLATGYDQIPALVDMWSVISSPAPLLLPEPTEDPAGAASARAVWRSLERLGHRFVLRPRIAAHFRKFERRSQLAISDARSRLDALILSAAPAAEYEEALKTLEALATLPPPVRVPRTTASFDRALDYRLLLEDNAEQMRQMGQLPEAGVLAGYWTWLNLRQAEESGDPARIKELRSEAASAHSLPKGVRELLRTQPEPLTPLAVQDGGDLVEKLVNSLRHIDEAEAAGVDRLAEAWSNLAVGRSIENADHRAVWLQLAGLPGGIQMWKLRDQAAGLLLSRLPGFGQADKAVSLDSTMRQHLEKAVAKSDWKAVRQMIAIALAGGALESESLADYARVAETFEGRADGPGTAGDYAELLHSTSSPAAAGLAALELKNVAATER